MSTDYQKTIDFYDLEANNKASRYDAIQRTLSGIEHVLRPGAVRVLDIGAGHGVDAAYFAEKGLQVTAVEPSALAEIGQQRCQHPNITWVNDRLPDLRALDGQEGTFDLASMHRVFMHVAPADQLRALERILSMLGPQGGVYMVNRHGPSFDDRHMFPVDYDVLKPFVAERGFELKVLSHTPDLHGRPEISWSVAVITRR